MDGAIAADPGELLAAVAHPLGFSPHRRSAGPRARAATRRLDELVAALASRSGEALPSGMEWVLDNHFVLRRATRQVRRGLTREFERHLPVLETGAHAGMRRIEVEAFAILRDSEGLVDREHLARKTREFGHEHDATLAELWALPLLLRLGLLEQLALDVPYLCEPTIDPEIDHRVANCVRSLLAIEKTDWARFVERVSEVQQILLGDPSGDYPKLDFATRDRYRRAVEALARHSPRSETSVAGEAIARAGSATAKDASRHVGHHLIGGGRPALARAIRHRPSLREAIDRTLRRHAGFVYVASIALVAALHVAGLAVLVSRAALAPGLTLLACVLAIVPVWTIGASLINWLVTLWVAPTPLPKLDFIDGIPAEHRTLIVVPGLLIRAADVDALARRIEAHWIATRDPHVEVAMLTDFADAASETRPDDDALIERARAKIAALNLQHPERPFHLLHRKRVWSERQGRWMGWERKRGKLEELNRLLRGDTRTTYVVHEGRDDHFAGFRYVLTLDADTILPLGTGRRLIETLAHPLNRARFDKRGRVRSGYTVLQPRTDIVPMDAPTRFARAFAGDVAFDIYTLAVSDVYQDLLGEGIFVGKGIYAIDDFQRSVGDRMPEDHILSHDLIEGLHGRAGLVSDVVVYEDYPSNWLAYARRLHRWIRGDWQLLAWLGPWVPVADGQRRPNRLRAIDRYKIVDNLRRSLLTPSLIGFALLAWLALPGPAWMWTGLIVALLATPLLTELASTLLRSLRPSALRSAISAALASTPAAIWRLLLRTAFMLHEAGVCVDAIARAIVRTTIIRRNQLEWTPAAIAGRGADVPRTILREMVPSLVLPPIFAVGLFFVHAPAVLGAAPLLLAWWSAPLLAIWTARAGRSPTQSEVEIDRAPLRRLARRTWAYFETVVGPDDHWLPPDNLQEQPDHGVAHRTSPTNIGMSLLATLAAHDLGHLDLLELVLRLRNTLETLDRLPRHRGHVLNWIDTRTLEPLEPRYVSTVDSGNLAATLVVLEQACRELALEARPVRGRFVGLADSFDVLADALAHWGTRSAEATRQVAAMRARITAAIADPRVWSDCLDALDDDAFMALDNQLLGLFQTRSAGDESEPARFEDLQTWATRVRAELASVRSELAVQLPWLERLAAVPEPIPSEPSRSVPARDERLAALRELLSDVPRLGQTERVLGLALDQLAALEAELDEDALAWRAWTRQLGEALRASRDHTTLVQTRLAEIATLAAKLIDAMDFAFLYDRERELTYIGYDVSSERFDDHHYDLLASEARLASLLGIAKGDMPLRHWAKLGRPIGRFGGGRGLLSWSGTMFEYLMTPLLLDEGRGTLLDVSARAAIHAQIAHARRLGLPCWGMSESGYARLDAQRNYQYRAFGVPATGFRRGLERDQVIAPYASVLALVHEPAAVVDNLAAIAAAGGFGPLGVYEALDFTRERVGLGRDHEVVRSYMSHHQGMVMLALHGYLCDRGMVRRMHRNPALRVVELLLHERSPGRVALERPQPAAEGPPVRARLAAAHGWPANTSPGVDAHVVSNGSYGLLITRAGAGHSWWKHVAITRPCQDPTLEDIGAITYLRDEDDGETWSSLAEHDESGREVLFTPHGATITIHHHDLVAELTVTIAPSEAAELRVLRLSDRSGRQRRLTITHYAELVLGSATEYERHPAFAKLFVDSQFVVDPLPRIVCRRRPRAPGERESWLACALISDTVVWSAYETEREHFVGRGRSLSSPAGSTRSLPELDTPLQATLDTCVAMSGRVELPAGGACECAFVCVYGSSRAEVLERAGRLSMSAVRRHVLDAERVAIERARVRGHDTEALREHQRLLSAVLFPRPELRAASEVLLRSRLGQPALWRHGISGDWPILLARVTEIGTGMITRLADAHSHWHERGVVVDLVILEDRSSSYDGSLRQRLAQLLEHAGARLSAPGGGVFVIHGASLEPAERDLLLSRASAVIEVEERERMPTSVPALPLFDPEGQPWQPTPGLVHPSDLRFDNGYGGFSPDGREYVVHLDPGRATPAPWVNVIANPQAGCVVSERGIGLSWSVNAGLRRLTAWSNDAVLDPPSASLYLRDELDGQFWSPLPGPAPDAAAYQVRHGAGQSTFAHRSHGLDQQVEIFVAPEDSVVVIRVALTDLWNRPRRLTLTLCIEWLLGVRRSDVHTLVTDFAAEHEVVLVHNSWNPTFADRWAFAAASERLHGITTSREEFFGRRGQRSSPDALRRIGLSGEIVHGGDPCTALQVHVDLPADARRELHFVFGDAPDRASALALATRWRSATIVDEARREVERGWDQRLGAIEVASPDPGFDLLVNRWLLYQAISSRLWGRTGFHQSSGAFGFRDQLQDAMALVHVAPERLRAHLLDAASRQFVEGDVLHWWHPPAGQGLRSRCSDDLLWLPYVTAHYVAATGDESILHESVHFLTAPTLSAEQHEQYIGEPQTNGAATFYEHCMRALERSSATGAHGLPRIGSCDWNDGFSHVGRKGRGESVWLGWFVRTTALAFASVCERLGRDDDARGLRERAAILIEPLESTWDGAWYLRAYHDDGTTLGSKADEACRIDSLAQSWAVLSKGAPEQRGQLAMQSVWSQLVMPDEGLVRLFTPAFHRAEAHVGYVEGYPPGVRENGGQYTHAAVWVAWAYAELGDIDRAWAIARMISPIAHGSDGEAIARYRVEPYVIAADIYGEAPHVGRGGWTWYTGAAAWWYRFAVERLLGVRRVEGRTTLAPMLPSEWPECRLILREAGAVYRVHVGKREHGRRVVGVVIDALVVVDLPLVLPAPDGREHAIEITLD